MKGTHFPTRMLNMAQDWRSGAAELREKFKLADKVPVLAEAGAAALEVCAERIESEVRAHYSEIRSQESGVSPLTPLYCPLPPAPSNPS